MASTIPRTLVLLLGALTAFSPLSIDMYLPSLPMLAHDFGVTTADVQPTVSAYLAGLVIGQLIYGPLSDAYGRRPPLYAGVCLYILASVGCAFAPSAAAMVGLRFLQALGGCVGLIIARAVVRDRADSAESARLFSMLILVMGAAPILAPLAGSYVLIWSGWRAIFLLLAGFGIACLAVSLALLPETLLPERRRAGGLVPALRGYGHLLSNSHFLGFALGGGFAFGNMFVYITGSPHLFIGVFDMTPTAYAWVFGANAAGLIAASQINRLLLRHFSFYRILSGALPVHLACVCALVLVAWLKPEVWTLWLILFLTISTLGLIGPNATAAALAEEPALAGSASSLTSTVPYLVGAIAGTLLGFLPDTGAISMAAVMAVDAAISFPSHRLLVGRAHLERA